MTRDGFLDRLGELPVPYQWIDDQQVDCFTSEEGVQLCQIRRGIQGMCSPQDEAKVSKEMTWKQSDDVQCEGRKILAQKPGFLSQNAGLRAVPRP